jgi:hypothetical protein
MGFVIKTILAFCIGIAAIAGVRTYWLSSVKEQLRTQQVTIPVVQPTPLARFDTTKMRETLYPKVPKIDPNIGKNAWHGTINRQISQSINAGRLVPQPPRIPGMRRH